MNAPGSWELINSSPQWLLAVAAIALIALISSLTSGRGVKGGLRYILILIRLLAVGAVAVAILRPAQSVDLTRRNYPPIAIVMDDSSSMSTGASPLSLSALSWRERVAANLTGLGEFYRLEEWRIGEPPAKVEAGTPEGFSRESSPIGASLEAISRLTPDLAGIILLTDGQDTERPGEGPPSLPVPVYPIMLEGGEVEDMWIEEVKTPPVGFIRTPVEIRVSIRSEGMGKGSSTLTLFEGDSPVESIDVETIDGENEVELLFTPRRTGRKAYSIKLSPREGERSLANNGASFSLSVIRDKTRVLLVAGTPTWDVKSLRRRLRQDPSVDLITFLILRTPSDLSIVPEDELSLIPFPTRELFEEELDSFDAVIFANFNYSPFVPGQYLQNIVNFVTEAGGGFAMLGGDRSFSRGGYEGSPITSILPVEISGALPGRGYNPSTFRPRLTEAGASHPIFQWRGDSEENQSLFASLPELSGLNWALRASPGAIVLAEDPASKNEYGPAPVIALGEFGSGRTMAALTDSLWKWGLTNEGRGGDGEVYRDFWSRTLRWLMHDPDMELVRLSSPPSGISAGEEVSFRARIFDRSYAPAKGATVKGTLLTSRAKATPLKWRDLGDGEYESEPVKLSTDGIYHLEAEGLGDGGLLGRDELSFPVERQGREGMRLGVNEEYLKGLASRSGGMVYEAADEGIFDTLAARGAGEVEVVGRKVAEPWANSIFLLLSLLLLAADWALRRFFE